MIIAELRKAYPANQARKQLQSSGRQQRCWRAELQKAYPAKQARKQLQSSGRGSNAAGVLRPHGRFAGTSMRGRRKRRGGRKRRALWTEDGGAFRVGLGVDCE